MTSIRKLGSSGLGTPVSLSSGLSTAPIPPSRLVPWHVAQFWAERVAPLAGAPGSAAPPEGEGEGELSASVVIAVSGIKAGIANATSAESLRRWGRRMARQIITASILGPRRE